MGFRSRYSTSKRTVLEEKGKREGDREFLRAEAVQRAFEAYRDLAYASEREKGATAKELDAKDERLEQATAMLGRSMPAEMDPGDYERNFMRSVEERLIEEFHSREALEMLLAKNPEDYRRWLKLLGETRP